MYGKKVLQLWDCLESKKSKKPSRTESVSPVTGHTRRSLKVEQVARTSPTPSDSWRHKAIGKVQTSLQLLQPHEKTGCDLTFAIWWIESDCKPLPRHPPCPNSESCHLTSLTILHKNVTNSTLGLNQQWLTHGGHWLKPIIWSKELQVPTRLGLALRPLWGLEETSLSVTSRSKHVMS